MNRSILVLSIVALACGAAGGVAACSSSSGGGATSGNDAGKDGTTVEGGGGGGDSGPEAAVDAGFAVTLPCSDAIADVYGDPGDVSGKAKGAILKCAHDTDYTAAQLLQASSSTETADGGGTPNYSGKPYTSGAHVYRVLYRTERGDTNNSPGYSSAAVFIPDTPRASTLPVVVASHGSRGQAAACAPSKMDPAAADVNPDFIHQVYSLVGFGYAVIAPDLAGYANFGAPGNPPSAYASAADVGKSTLDGVAALRNLLPPSSLSQKVIITGHSQGGHTALSALALSSSYPVSGTIAGVAVYSPLWISQHAWAAIFVEPQNYGFAESSAGVVSLWYHVTHSMLLDGQDAGMELIQPSQQGVVTGFLNNDCWSASYPDLYDAGASANDFFLSSYVTGIEIAATPIGNGDCKGNQQCQTWLSRMTADWPHLSGTAAQVPVLVWYANGDTTITPDAMQCVFNRLSGDNAPYSICYDPNPVGHSGVVAADSNYVADWIAQQAMGAAAPGESCQALAKNDGGVPQLVDEGGTAIPCNPLLPTE